VISPVLIAAFIAGLAGSAHCFGMCGGLAGALGMRARLASSSPIQGAMRALLFHVGRIGGYATVGAIGGALGHSVHWALDLTRFESVLRIIAGTMTLLIGARVLFRVNALAWLERFGARLWRHLRPLTNRASTSAHWLGPIAMGLLWGWLPCGLVYSMLLMTFAAGNAITGAAMMAAFGLGTLPAMASFSIALGTPWSRVSAQPCFRSVTGAALIILGVWMIVGAQFLHSSAHTHSL